MRILNIKMAIVLWSITYIFSSIPVQAVMRMARVGPAPARPMSVMGTLSRQQPLTSGQLKQGAGYVKKYPEFKGLNADQGYRMQGAYQKSKANLGLSDRKKMFSKEEAARVQAKQKLRQDLVHRYQNPNAPVGH